MDQTTLTTIVSQYALHLQAEKGLAPSTRNSYLTAVRAFLGRCAAAPEQLLLPEAWTPASLDKRALELHLNALRDGRNWKAGALAQQASALHAFFRYLQAQGHIQEDPAGSLRPRLPEAPPPPPSGEEAAVQRMFRRRVAGFEDARLLALLELLYGAGLRPSQAYRTRAVTAEAGGRVRIALPEDALEAVLSAEGLARLETYQTLRARAASTAPDAPFWVDARGHACSPARLARQVRRAMEAEDLAGGPAVLRQLAARHFIQRGGDLRSMQKLLRAKRLGRLDRYQDPPDFAGLVAQFKQAHPRQEEK